MATLAETCSLDSVSDEIVLRIFSYLKARDLLSCSLINHRFLRLVRSNRLPSSFPIHPKKQYTRRLVTSKALNHGLSAWAQTITSLDICIPSLSRCYDWKYRFSTLLARCPHLVTIRLSMFFPRDSIPYTFNETDVASTAIRILSECTERIQSLEIFGIHDLETVCLHPLGECTTLTHLCLLSKDDHPYGLEGTEALSRLERLRSLDIEMDVGNNREADFLSYTTSLEHFSFGALNNIARLTHLSCLSSLEFHPNIPNINFSIWPLTSLILCRPNANDIAAVGMTATRLKRLALDDYTHQLLAPIVNCRELTSLEVGSGEESSRIQAFGPYVKLRAIHLDAESIEDIAVLGQCAELTSVSLCSAHKIRDVSFLGNCFKLRHFHVCGASHLQQGLNALYTCRHLVSFELGGAPGIQDLGWLARCKHLKSVWLKMCAVPESQIKQLEEMGVKVVRDCDPDMEHPEK